MLHVACGGAFFAETCSVYAVAHGVVVFGLGRLGADIDTMLMRACGQHDCPCVSVQV
jgi:hypothetical protein